MNKRTILFRTDGGTSIGMGHFIRSLALAEMLNQHFFCIFATRKPTEYQIAEIEKVCHARVDLPEDDSHFDQFLTYLKGDEIVVLDNYYFTTEYQRIIKIKGCSLVCIDDIYDKHFVADIVINHAEGVDPNVYSVEKYTKLLLGYQYALLRKVFRETSFQVSEKRFACMVIMGGTDPLGITSLLIKLLDEIEFNRPVAVVNGINNSRIENTTGREKFIFYKNQTAEQMVRLMSYSCFGILPASTVAIEACAVRLPFICGYFVDNQKQIYDGIRRNKLAVCIGDFTKLTQEQFKKAKKKMDSPEIIKNMMSKQIQSIDNHSNQRFIKEFLKL